MKVLVMGGTRFNGLALVQELVKWGHEVTVLNRGQSAARLPRAVRRLYADRTNREQLREVEHTYDWFQREKLSGSRQFDFSWEDNLLERLGAR